MRRVSAVVLGTVLLMIAPMAIASATIGFSQQVRLRNDPTNHQGYVRTYTSFPDGYDNCSYMSGQPNQNPCTPAKGGGKIRIVPLTYRLVEENKSKDYYLVDLTVSTSGRYGSKDYAYLDATIQNTTKVTAATYSNGKSTVSGCKKYPISIGAGWGPLSASTTVGSFSVDCHSTSISRKATTSGQKYHVTNLSAVKSVTFQRFVVVPKGVKPTFRYTVSWPTDSCHTSTVSDGSNSHKFRSCKNSSASLTKSIGTGG